jgi:hypothetical protein
MTANTRTDDALAERVRASDRAESVDLSTDEVFHLLKNSRRREVVAYFIEHDGPVDIGTLADWIAARETDASSEDVPNVARQRVYVALYQSHLPKLDDHDVVEYGDDGTVARGPNAPPLETLLEYERSIDWQRTDDVDGDVDGEDDGRWTPYLVGLSAGGVLSLGVSWIAGLTWTLSLRVLNVLLLGIYTAIVTGQFLRLRQAF